MAANIFSPVKKKVSPYANAFSSNVKFQGAAPASSAYSTPKPYASPVSGFASNAFNGGGATSLTTAMNTTRKPVQMMSTMPTSALPTPTLPTRPTLPASPGMSTPGAALPAWAAPRPAPTPVPTPSASDSYLALLQKSGADRAQAARDAQTSGDAITKAQYGLLNKTLDQSGQAYKDSFDQYKQGSEAGIADLTASGERQKSGVRDYTGEAQRLAAQTRRETQGQTQRTFSNLGTIDSTGEGSFQQATNNQDSEFNRFTQTNLKEQANKLAEIDSTVGQATRAATLAIQKEQSTLNGLLAQIETSKASNNLEQTRTLVTSYNDTQQRIYDIQDAIDQVTYQSGLEKEKLTLASKALTKEREGLSQGFITTGVPENMNDFFYRTNEKHAGAYEKITASAGGASQSSATKALEIAKNIRDIANGGKEGITGNMTYAISGDSRKAEGLLKQLMGELQLEDSKRLKGQGTITNAERQMLADAIGALNLKTDKNGAVMGRSKLDLKDFNSEINLLIEKLSAKSGVTDGGSASSVQMIAPDGQTYTVSQDEVQESLRNGWRAK